MRADTGIAAHGSTIPGYASLTSLFNDEQQLSSSLDNLGSERRKRFGASHSNPTGSLFQALLPIANMIGSGTTNLTQISGHLSRVEFDQSMRYLSLPSPTVPVLDQWLVWARIPIFYIGLPAGIPAGTVIC